MKKNRIISGMLSLALLISCAASVMAEEPEETARPRVSSGGGESWTEELNRGLVAVPVDGGVYLSWRLFEDEDALFGYAAENVEFDIYRDGERIATESNTTNYLDADGTASSEYAVVPSGAGLDSLKNTISFSGRDISVNIAEGTNYRGLKAYAAKYTDGNLSELESFDITESGKTAFTASFDVDKAFLWDGMEPVKEEITSSALIMSSDGYLTIPLEKPAAVTLADGNIYSYTANDISCGDLDGDGDYELIVKWDCNGQDNSNAGYTGNVLLDAYDMEKGFLWRIDLGQNIRAGAHYTQFLVYDFDDDGKSEITCRTAPGSKDSTGEYVTKASSIDELKNVTDEENQKSYVNDGGYIITGPEYFTIFNGDGKAVDTIDYPTARVSASDWNDNYGNRCDRFLATVAYLDGEKPYAVYWRGYYDANGRTGVAAMSFDGEKLSVDYKFDTKKGRDGYTAGNEKYTDQGNHNITAADVDNDGKDEFISGALCFEVNDENKLMPLWCSYRQHGDALHIGDYDPTHEGLEYFSVHEHGWSYDKDSSYAYTGDNIVIDDNGNEKKLDYGMTVYDAATGEELYHSGVPTTRTGRNKPDTGRGVMANVGAGGFYQFWGEGTYMALGDNKFETTSIAGASSNFRIFWDGDLYDNLLDGVSVSDWNENEMKMENIFTADNCHSNNGTKSTPGLTADLFGDWREEIVCALSDDSALRVFTTTTKTDYKIKTLMHDRVYRSGVAAEQTAYNQPPHIGFYLSDDLFYGTLTGIELDASNAKKTYYLGEEFDKSGIKVTGTYSDAADRELSAYSVSGYDPMKTGEQTITVKYMTYSDTYTVNVIGESSITAQISKDTYKAGEALDKSAVTVKLVYTDGTEKEVEGFKISGYDSMKVGEQILSITYEGLAETYTADVTVTVTTGLVIENGVVTSYSGDDTEIVIPLEYNGEAVAAIADGALADASALTKIYIYSEDIVINGDSTFPAGVTIVCYEGSTAQAYADAHGITTEIMTKGDAVTFEENFYADYVGKNMFMQSGSEASLKDEFITYNTHAADSRAPWYADNTYGFAVASEGDGNYLKVNAGIYDSQNQFNQVYITLNSPKPADEDASVSFDIMFPSGGNSPYVEIQNDAGTVIDTISGLSADTWYRYELTYSSGAYVRTIYDADGNAVSSDSLSVTVGNTAVSYIVFKQGFTWGNGGITGIVNIDNILLK